VNCGEPKGNTKRHQLDGAIGRDQAAVTVNYQKWGQAGFRIAASAGGNPNQASDELGVRAEEFGRAGLSSRVCSAM